MALLRHQYLPLCLLQHPGKHFLNNMPANNLKLSVLTEKKKKNSLYQLVDFTLQIINAV